MLLDGVAGYVAEAAGASVRRLRDWRASLRELTGL